VITLGEDATATVERRAWSIRSTAPDECLPVTTAIHPTHDRPVIVWVARTTSGRIRVQDQAGYPVANARVSWSNAPFTRHAITWMGSTLTDETGLARFDGLPGGSISLAASAAGYEQVITRRPSLAAETTLTLPTAQRFLHIRATAATDGELIPDGLTFTSPAGELPADRLADGTWMLRAAPPPSDTTWIAVQREGWLTTRVYPARPDESVGSADFPMTVPLHPAVRVTVELPPDGRIVDATATVDPYPELSERMFVDTEAWRRPRAGTGQISFLAPQHSQVRFQAISADDRLCVAAGRTTDVDIILTCEPFTEASLELAARSATGQPVASFAAYVQYGSELSWLRLDASPETGGSVSIAGAEFVEQIRIRAAGFQEANLSPTGSPEPQVTAHQAIEKHGRVEATLYATHTVRIEVLDTAGHPVPGATVTAYPVDASDVLASSLGTNSFATGHEGWHEQRRAQTTAHTGIDGAATLRLADGTWSTNVQTWGRNRLQGRLPADVFRNASQQIEVHADCSHTITIPDGRAVHVTVVDHLTQRPLTGVRVVVDHESSPSTSGKLSEAGGAVVVLGADARQLQFVKGGYASVSVPPPDGAELTVALTPDSTKRIRLVLEGSADRGLAGSRVQVSAWDGPGADAGLIWMGRPELLEESGEQFSLEVPLTESAWIRIVGAAGTSFEPHQALWSPGDTLRFRTVPD
jgi:hypothetical protein